MQESFLHYIWRHQYFNKTELTTHEGEEIVILSPGFYNENAGPDFSEAKIKIGSVIWSGSIEIHIKSSDWKLHNHDSDDSYDNVVMHVVWDNNKRILRTDGSEIPTLELKHLIDHNKLDRYNMLVNSSVTNIPCESSFGEINDLTKLSMLDKVVMERLLSKTEKVNDNLKQTQGDWEETTYRLLAQSFGLKVNTECFDTLSKTVPFKIIKKYNFNLLLVEALLFGASGFLKEELDDDYHQSLKKEYTFLNHKHDIDTLMEKSHWKFMRLRPANFPTIRLAQFASILHSIDSIFQKLISTSDIKEFKKWFKNEPSEYWKDHYNFGENSAELNKGIGDQTIEIIIINAAVPLLVAYGKSIDDQMYIDKAISILESLKPEKNKITKVYAELGFKSKSSFDSQGLIQLHNQYCVSKLCLNCSIGTSIVGNR